jgi:hypothetical protein
MDHTLITLATLLLAATVHAEAVETLPGLVYAPEGDAIVIHNGTVWGNRPLYCNARHSVVLAGEMPSLSGPMGSLYVGIGRGAARVLLQQFSRRVARYRPGRMEWEMSDPRFPGRKARLVGTTLADASGFAVRLVVEGAQPGDSVAWCVFPASPEKPSVATKRAEGFQFAHVLGRCSAPVGKWEQLAWADREDIRKAVANGKGTGLVAWIPLESGKPQYVAVAADENDMYFKRPLDPSSVADAAQAFADGLARVEALGRRVRVETPDPYFNAGVAASCAAVRGLYVHPCFVHGGTAWRFQQPGWRMMGGAFSYGWHQEVRNAVEFWGRQQSKRHAGKTSAQPSDNGCEQGRNSRFYGAGFLRYGPIAHQGEMYDFQTQFFDEAVREWRATADPAYEKLLLPMLELQLDRAKACFDPDGDGLYESYNNTWPSDSVWFSGGATPEASAYAYYGRQAAADMRRRRGDKEAAAKHDAEADKIRAAVQRVLWLKDKGQFASFVEQGEKKRLHCDAWIYAQHVPIEAGVATPVQSWQAMYYTQWAMQRYRFPFGGEMRQTSNWVPGQWSIRELFHGDNFAMALGYFLGGQGDDGWQILRGTMLETMYGDATPKAGYSDETAGYGRTNYRAPGGLSQPNCGIDFNDITTMFARAVVEGLFGYRPDYPNRIVHISPAFPSAWDHASIRTPDFALAYRQDGVRDVYHVSLTRPAAVRFRVPVRAEKVKRVTLNGQAAKWKIEPWAGCGMLSVDAPADGKPELAVELEGRTGQLPSLTAEREDGEPGHHLVLKTVEGAVPRYQVTEVYVPERPETRVLREAPAGAKWKSIDVSGVLNADVRSIFKQDYRSPRPNTVSMRVGFDGWSAWTFPYWHIKLPDIELENAGLKLIGSERTGKLPRSLLEGDRLLTPQHVPFTKPGAQKNIAFTSLWDNWPRSVTVPVNAKGDAVWLLVCGSTTPMQGRIANAVLRFRYADGREETLDLVPPWNFWSLCKFGNADYDYRRDGFALPKNPPPQVQLGRNCRAMVYGWKLRPGVALKDVTLETLSQEVVVGLMGASVMNPR